MVPLTLLRKGALKSFDLSGPDGNSMPVLGRSENAWLATGVLAHEIVGLSEPEPEIITAIRRIVESAPDAAKDVAAELLMGRYKGKTLLNSDDLTDTARLLIQELAECFLLIALLPSELAGKRGVIKYSFHWRPVPSRGLNWGTRLLAAGGYCGAIHQIELGRPSDAASYHLEVHAPIGLICGNLKLPTTANENNDSPPIFGEPPTSMVAHEVGVYESALDGGEASLELLVPRGGLRSVALLTGLFTAATFTLERLLPGAHQALLRAPDGAVAILLALPAVALALLARPGENTIAAHILLPLRWAVLACAGLLGVAAASLVGVLHEPYVSLLWWFGVVFSLLVLGFLVVGHAVSARWDAVTTSGNPEEGRG
jgi:hypothetical protein